MDKKEMLYETKIPDSAFKKASFSSTEGACVEVARVDGAIGVRDSKNRGKGTLVFNQEEWDAFLGGVRAGEFG